MRDRRAGPRQGAAGWERERNNSLTLSCAASLAVAPACAAAAFERDTHVISRFKSKLFEGVHLEVVSAADVLHLGELAQDIRTRLVLRGVLCWPPPTHKCGRQASAKSINKPNQQTDK